MSDIDGAHEVNIERLLPIGWVEILKWKSEFAGSCSDRKYDVTGFGVSSGASADRSNPAMLHPSDSN